MSDPIAQAAESMNAAPVSADPTPPAESAILAGEPPTPVNLPADEPAAPDAAPSRESLIARMHAKLDALEAKIGSGVVVFAHEVRELRDYIKQVL